VVPQQFGIRQPVCPGDVSRGELVFVPYIEEFDVLEILLEPFAVDYRLELVGRRRRVQLRLVVLIRPQTARERESAGDRADTPQDCPPAVSTTISATSRYSGSRSSCSRVSVA
jgi:hypothetical protein